MLCRQLKKKSANAVQEVEDARNRARLNSMAYQEEKAPKPIPDRERNPTTDTSVNPGSAPNIRVTPPIYHPYNPSDSTAQNSSAMFQHQIPDANDKPFAAPLPSYGEVDSMVTNLLFSSTVSHKKGPAPSILKSSEYHECDLTLITASGSDKFECSVCCVVDNGKYYTCLDCNFHMHSYHSGYNK